jgi:RNA polymerase sigma-70 factor (ECF subfamily)
MLGERADAEEVTLDAFVQAWRNAKSYQPVRGSVPAWLTTIARNRALDLLRARQRRGRLAAVASAAPDLGTPGMSEAVPDASADAEQAERRRQVALALDTLSPVQREVVELAFYGGLTQTEIAARLGEPLGTVKTRARLAMQKLRIALGPYHFEQGA